MPTKCTQTFVCQMWKLGVRNQKCKGNDTSARRLCQINLNSRQEAKISSKIGVTIMKTAKRTPVSVVTLKRTDTTLDLSQKAKRS